MTRSFVRRTSAVLNCAAFVAVLHPSWLASPRAETTIFDVDLRRGGAGPGKVHGGRWKDGWILTGAPHERIVFDAGRPIVNGYLETEVTIDVLPWIEHEGKINWVGLHEHSSLNQNEHGNDLFYARTGNARFAFSAIKAAGRAFDRTEWDVHAGQATDWVPDGKTAHRVRLEWRDGVALFRGPGGANVVSPRAVIGTTPLDALRYAFIGSDGYSRSTVRGMRFLRLKLVDLGPDVPGPEPLALRVDPKGRRLIDAEGRAMFLAGDLAPEIAHALDREALRAHLRVRRDQQVNLVTLGLLDDGNVYGDPAFDDSTGGMNPRRPRVTPGAEPSDSVAYDYWDHVDFAVREVARLGLYVVVAPLSPARPSGRARARAGKAPAVQLDPKNAYAYGRFLGERYGRLAHALWLVETGALRRGGTAGGWLRVTGDPLAIAAALIEGLADGRNGVDAFDGRSDFSGLLVGLEAGGPVARSLGPSTSRSDGYRAVHWVTFDSGSASKAVVAAAIAGRPADFASPVLAMSHPGAASADDRRRRKDLWRLALGGSAGHLVRHGTQARSDVAPLSKFVNAFNDPLSWTPRPSLVEAAPRPRGAAREEVTAADIPGRSFVIIHVPDGRNVRVRLDQLAKPPTHVWWFNPRSGNWLLPSGDESVPKKPFVSGFAPGANIKVYEFDPPGQPGEDNDWILVLSPSPVF